MSTEVRLSEVADDPDKLAKAVIDRYRADFDWRREVLGGATTPQEDPFRKAIELFENFTENSDDPDVPRVNLIHRAVEDFMSVALSNIPKARLKSKRYIGKVPEWEKPIRHEIINMATENINAYVKDILMRNKFGIFAQKWVAHAAIVGMGCLKVDVDRSLDVRQDYRIRDLMNKKEPFTLEEMELLEVLSKRPDVKVIDPRDVLFQNQIRDYFDEDEMNRCSIVERFQTISLREAWKDSEYLDDPELIQPGSWPYFIGDQIDETSVNDSLHDSITAQVTMWELELEQMEKVIEDEETGEKETFTYNDWRMHKIVIAGSQLVEYETWTSEEGPVHLPLIPMYLRKSYNHPYGWSLARMLEKSEEYINAIQTIIFKSARKSVVTNGVLIAVPNMSQTDLDEINTVLEEGGVGYVRGNNPQGLVDVRDMVMPLNYNAAPINPILLQATDMQMRMFGNQSQEVDAGAIGSARSGVAKRQQIAVADRPKTISINFMSDSIETLYNRLFEIIRVMHTNQVQVTVEDQGGESKEITLNEEYTRNVIILDEEAQGPENPLGLRIVQFKATLNSLLLELYAESEGRSELPLDMISKFQIMIALAQNGLIQPETFRFLTLTDEIRAYDDMVTKNKEQDQLRALMEQVETMRANPMGGMASGAPPLRGDGAMGPNMEDSQARIDSMQGSPLATPSSPFA